MRTAGGIVAEPARGPTVRLALVRGDQIAQAQLAPGTAAQVIRRRGAFLVQVAESVPPHLWRQIAQHTIDRHQTQCITSHCVKAREWLALRPVVEEEAIGA